MARELSVTGNMISSMKGLDEIAMPPDYLQMHRGAYDEVRFEQFAEGLDYVEDKHGRLAIPDCIYS